MCSWLPCTSIAAARRPNSRRLAALMPITACPAHVCVCAQVHGHTDVKRAILLMLLGGMHKTTREVCCRCPCRCPCRCLWLLRCGCGCVACSECTSCFVQQPGQPDTQPARHPPSSDPVPYPCFQHPPMLPCRASTCVATSTWPLWATPPAPSRRCSSEPSQQAPHAALHCTAFALACRRASSGRLQAVLWLAAAHFTEHGGYVPATCAACHASAPPDPPPCCPPTAGMCLPSCPAPCTPAARAPPPPA